MILRADAWHDTLPALQIAPAELCLGFAHTINLLWGSQNPTGFALLKSDECLPSVVHRLSAGY